MELREIFVFKLETNIWYQLHNIDVTVT